MYPLFLWVLSIGYYLISYYVIFALDLF